MSLQIHQTGKLDILTRAIPVDAEDIAANTFVASHGSIDAVVYDRELVKEFAQQQHLVMDDSAQCQYFRFHDSKSSPTRRNSKGQRQFCHC
jgi:hypothetical protein